jgi:[protein-PII] uridylyltransferase
MADQPLLNRSALQAELGMTSSAARAEGVAAVKLIRNRELTRIGERYQADPQSTDGLAVCSAITAVTDAVVMTLVERAFSRVDAPKDWSNQVGIFATGGYGREEMNPYSDVDLLVLSAEGREPAWLTRGWPELQALLWDVKFTVGAAKRSAPELSRILEDDFVTTTAILERRTLMAGEPVREILDAVLNKVRRRQALPFLRFKLEELRKRRDQVGVSLFRMEPNLKSNPGCLRDVQLLRNIAHVIFASRQLGVLSKLDVVSAADLEQVDATNCYLLGLRSLLHFHHQRKQDVLQLADQVRLASAYGFADLSSLRAVEHFMKDHYGRVLHVHQTVELVISRLRSLGHLGRRLILIKSRRTLNADFVTMEGQVFLSNKEFWTLPDFGGRLLRMCRLAQSRDVRLSLDLQRTIKAHVHLINEQDLHDHALGRVLLEILGDAGRCYPILSDMHNAGLLGAYLPEFGNLTCHMQFDSWHQYTVDQHTLLAISYLDQVAQETLEGLPRMTTIFPRIRRKDLLVLGLLLHDMGKYMGRGHVARGALMVSQVAERIGLDNEEEDLVYFLVERHVSLSDASRMRNFHEPSFLTAFAEKMGNQENLDALYCLTYCDAKAVGDGVLTGWQEAILGELHLALSEQLAGSHGAHLVNSHQRLVQELVASGVKADDAEAFLGEFPMSYAHQVRPGELPKHLQVLEQAKREGLGLRYEISDAGISVAAAVPDRHALFADVTATLTGHGFDIIEARTWVSRHGMVVYNFRLSSIYPTRVREEASWRRLYQDLLLVSRGELDAAKMLEKRRTALVAKPANSGFDDPAIKVEQRTSDHFTIVDVHTKDEVGLLSRLCRCISEYGCSISYACINTMGDVAVDVFYVDRAGAKLQDADAEELRMHLITRLDLQVSRSPG